MLLIIDVLFVSHYAALAAAARESKHTHISRSHMKKNRALYTVVLYSCCQLLVKSVVSFQQHRDNGETADARGEQTEENVSCGDEPEREDINNTVAIVEIR